MARVIDVAEMILNHTGSITTWKLQKLVYYAQAWHAVWEEKQLFDSKIEAWANGPVCPELYNLHKGQFTVENVPFADISRLSESEKENIIQVVKFYEQYSGQHLSDLTHMEMPWKKARKGLQPDERGNIEITLDSMVEYYGALEDCGEGEEQKASTNCS